MEAKISIVAGNCANQDAERRTQGRERQPSQPEAMSKGRRRDRQNGADQKYNQRSSYLSDTLNNLAHTLELELTLMEGTLELILLGVLVLLSASEEEDGGNNAKNEDQRGLHISAVLTGRKTQ